MRKSKENKPKEIDTTKTGPAGYKQLQEANAAQFNTTGLGQDYLQAQEDLEDMYSPTSLFDARAHAQQAVTSSLAGDRTPWGGSMFDKTSVNEYEFNNLQDIRANNQPWYAQLTAGIAKGGILAGTTFVNGTAGLVAGIGTAIAEGRISGIWDNDVTRFMDHINELSEEALPNYYTEKEQYGSIMDNIFTANFWGDKFLKNVGFTIGAFYSGNLYAKGIGALLKSMNVVKGAATTKNIVGSFISAVNEGSIEGLHSANDFEKTHLSEIENSHARVQQQLWQEYEANRGKNIELIDGKYVDKAWIDYKTKFDEEDRRYEGAKAKLAEDKAKVGNTTLALNIPILMASNIYQFGRLYAGGFKQQEALLRGINRIQGTPGKYTTKNWLVQGVRKRAGKFLSEGSEEFAQTTGSTTQQAYYGVDFNNYHRASLDPEYKKEALSWWSAMSETIAKNISDTNSGSALEEFFIGGITGLLGMPGFRSTKSKEGKWQFPIFLQDGLFNGWQEDRDRASRTQAIVDKLNARTTSPEMMTYYNGLLRRIHSDKTMQEALKRGDKFDYKNSELFGLVSDIAMFAEAGRLGDFKAIISQQFDTSDEAISQLVEDTKIEVKDANGNPILNTDGKPKTVSAYTDGQGNILPKEQIIEKIEKEKEDILKTVDKYTNVREEIDKQTGGIFTSDQLAELTWMRMQIDDWTDRSKGMSDKIKDSLQKARQIYAQKAEKWAQEALALSESSPEEYAKAQKLANDFSTAMRTMDKLLSYSDDGLITGLSTSKNKGILTDIAQLLTQIDDSVIPIEQKNELLDTYQDLQRLSKARDMFSQKLVEFLLNPESLQEEHARTEQKMQEKESAQIQAEELNAINKASNFGEIVDLLNNGTIAPDNIEKGTSEVAKNWRRANLFRQKAKALIDSSDSEHKDILTKMLENRLRENSTYDDLANIKLLTALPQEVQALDSVSQDTLINAFNKIIEEAKKKVDSGASQPQNHTPQSSPPADGGRQGKDEVPGTPGEVSVFDKTREAIDKSPLSEETKDTAKKLIDHIQDLYNKAKQSKAVKTIHELRSKVNDLYSILGTTVQPLVDKINNEFKPEVIQAGTGTEVLDELEKEITPVTGTIKTIIPEFDIDAKNDGKLIPFVDVEQNRNKGYAWVYNKLSEPQEKAGNKSAFDYINEGNVKKGDKVKVVYEPATEEHPELLALYHNDVLINYLTTNTSVEGIAELMEAAKKAHEDKDAESPEITVTTVMNGAYGHSRTAPRPIAELLEGDDAIIGVSNGDIALHTNTDQRVENHYDSANSAGRVYILLPNSKGTLSPKRVNIRHLNGVEYDLKTAQGSFADKLREVFRNMANLVNETGDMERAMLDIFYDLTELLYTPDDFHINVIQDGPQTKLKISFNDRKGQRQNRFILLRTEESQSFDVLSSTEVQATTTPASKEDVDNVLEQIIKAFYEANLPFNINRKKLTGKDGQKYANELRDANVLTTYLTGKRMRGTWLIFNEKPGTHSGTATFEAQRAAQRNNVGVRVRFKGQEYAVKNGVIYNLEGAVVYLGNDNQEVRDLAHIESAYGDSMYGANQHDGLVLIEDANSKRGYNRRTGKYLTQEELKKLEATLEGRQDAQTTGRTAISKILETSQKKVLRTEDGHADTSSGSYMVLEDDGQWHPYDRVHTVIGSNYKGQSRGDGASRGTAVDEFARQFLLDPTSAVRPNTLSDTAASKLRRYLAKFKAKLKEDGFVLYPDRVVVTHKYSDGRRIAGELDILAFNPSTGEIRIYDFKTSKYSTKDEEFSVVKRPDLFSRSNKEQYTLQLSAYKELIEDSTGAPVSQLTLLPYRLTPDTNPSAPANAILDMEEEPAITLDYVSAIKGVTRTGTPQATPGKQGKSEKKAEAPATKRVVRGATAEQASKVKLKEGQVLGQRIYKGEPELIALTPLTTVHNNGNPVTLYTWTAKSGNVYVILPNGIGFRPQMDITTEEGLNSLDDPNILRGEKMKTNPLLNSPFGDNVVVPIISEDKGDSKKKEDISDKLSSVDELLGVRPAEPGSTDAAAEAAEKKRKEEKQKEVSFDITSEAQREAMSLKSWNELSSDQQAFLSEGLGGTEDAMTYWDSTDNFNRLVTLEALMSCK